MNIDSDFILFLATIGVLIIIFGITYIIGKDYKKKKRNTTPN